MAPVREVSGGGTFLIRSLNPDRLFTREDLSDEQRLFGQTAAEFMRKEVLPNEASLYAHDWVKTRELLKKAADLDLFPVERAYRDARITRIYEGTNEINRVIIATRLLKNSDPLLEQPADEDVAGSVLQPERQALSHVKRLARTSLGTAAQAIGAGVRDEQEVLAHAANVIIECYAIESVVGRTEKMTARGSERAAIAVDIARAYTSDALDHVAHAGKQIVNALARRTGDDDRLRAAVARVNEHPGTDTVAARRRIGDAAIAQSR